ncbi:MULTISPECIES: hypothetical protein [unclassified Caballeronia]|uniref:hypothetical protein n=1 Tax=unclassified Caballeronia TaxID=2646786 RepID=UPI0028617B40|nr:MULTISPECIES: hypothetical protein [unclassified Caballeronia]MDR5776814.1 hypothetical protein [Caballeronia sp. LZ002]MDR5798673.1 hypothetical protein [Caballeronia sp. LZ001]MDR5852254.1 hypothetical protein [Caballeronia sp. LZ003]
MSQLCRMFAFALTVSNCAAAPPSGYGDPAYLPGKIASWASVVFDESPKYCAAGSREMRFVQSKKSFRAAVHDRRVITSGGVATLQTFRSKLCLKHRHL